MTCAGHFGLWESSQTPGQGVPRCLGDAGHSRNRLSFGSHDLLRGTKWNDIANTVRGPFAFFYEGVALGKTGIKIEKYGDMSVGF